MKRLLFLSTLFLTAIDAGIIYNTIPLSFHDKRSFVGFMQEDDGMWYGLPQDVYGEQQFCPRFYNLIGDYSFTLVAQTYQPPAHFMSLHPELQHKKFAWVEVQVLFNALFMNKRLIQLKDGREILLSAPLFNALRTKTSIDRLQQLLPSLGGVCVVDVCCRRS